MNAISDCQQIQHQDQENLREEAQVEPIGEDELYQETQEEIHLEGMGTAIQTVMSQETMPHHHHDDQEEGQQHQHQQHQRMLC